MSQSTNNINNNPYTTKNPASEYDRTFNCKNPRDESSPRCDNYYNRNKPTFVNYAANFLGIKGGKKRKTTKKKKTKKVIKKHRRKTNKTNKKQIK